MHKALVVAPLVLAVLLSLGVSLTVTHAVGVDIHFHMDIATEYARGNLAGAWNIFYGVNHAFYPPLFHLLLVPGVWMQQVYGYTLVLQVLFLPLALGLFMYFVGRCIGRTEAFLGGLILLGSMAFVDRVLQPQAQGIDFMLWSLAMYFYFAKPKGWGWVASSVLMAYNHGLVSIATAGSQFLLRVREHRHLLLYVLAVLPIVAFSFYTLVSALGLYGSWIDTDQELMFRSNPANFWLRYVGVPTFGFVVAGYFIIKKKLSAISKLAVLSLPCLAVMIPVWPDRFGQYATLPLTLLIIEFYGGLGRAGKFVLFGVVAIAFVIQYSWLWILTLGNGWVV